VPTLSSPEGGEGSVNDANDRLEGAFLKTGPRKFWVLLVLMAPVD